MCCCTWTQDELEDLVGTKLQSLTPKCIDTLRAIHKATGCKCHGDHLYWHTGPGTRHTLEESGYQDCYNHNALSPTTPPGCPHLRAPAPSHVTHSRRALL